MKNQTNKLTLLFVITFAIVAFIQCRRVSDPVGGSPGSPSANLSKLSLVSPTDDAKNQSTELNLTWKKIEGADSYQIQISEKEDFSTTLKDSVTEKTSFKASSLQNDSTYYWRVKEKKDNAEGPWSEIWSFTTSEQDNQQEIKAKLSSPTDGTRDQATDLTFKWETNEGANKYHFQLSDDEDFSNLVADSAIEATSMEIKNLSGNQQYHWRVSPILNSATGTWSDEWSFTTTAESTASVTTDLLAPEDGSQNQSADELTLKWDDVQQATEYHIEVAKDSEFSSLAVDSMTDSASLKVSDLESNQRYHWRVAPRENTENGKWTDTWTFRTEAASSTPPPNASSFISVSNSDFVADGATFRFAGTNAYYLPNYDKVDPSVVTDALDAFEEAGVTVVRMWAFYDGPAQYSNDISIQPQAGVYNEDDLKHLDNVIAEGKKHGIRFILTLVNYWDELGGIAQYNEWDGSSGGGMSHFMSDPDTKQWFKDYIKMLANRTNTATGVAYKNEPAIFSWEIMNEGRNGGEDATVIRDWYQEIAQYIKSIDANHMVSTGEEGFDADTPTEYSVDQYSNTYVLRSGDGTSYILNTSIPEIDYGSAHWYPQTWGFGNNINQDMITAQHTWINDHQKIAENLGKPFVLGEYGLNGFGDDRVVDLYGDLWDYAESVQLDGSLLWELTAGSTKCYEYGGNICWPGGRADQGLYNDFKAHIQTMNGN